tara:strand:- start:914 stop:1588 length:675 start_codon:yes stop_codon:yes gene_type:complete
MKDLTLIIPAKNESESLPKVLDELKIYPYNINIVLHESDKKTINSIEQYNVKIIYQKNFGYGDAIIEGINKCETKYFCIFNADGSFNPKELDLMINKTINENLDFLFASRYQNNSGSEDDTIVTLIGNYFFTFVGKIFFNLNISDILYTYVLGKTESTHKLKLNKKDFTLCVELPIKAQRNNMKMASIGSYERIRIGGKKKVNAIKDGFLILIYLIKIFFNKKI